MRVAVVTNFNGRGLERDAEVVEGLLSRAGHESDRVPWAMERRDRYDLAIFLEVAPAWAMGLAPRRWLVPNPEWWHHSGHGSWLGIDAFERVICKTRESLRIFSDRTPCAVFTGFAARDRHLNLTPRERRFLCVAGVSVAKGADAVIKAWEIFRLPYRLTVAGKLFSNHSPVPNVEFRGHVGDDDLRSLQNACLFHVQPSWTEGFGMTLHEGLSCGAIMLTTDAPPMNEIPAGAYVTPMQTRQMCVATAYRCRPQEIYASVEELWCRPDDQLLGASARARTYFEESCRLFEDRFLTLLQ